MFTVWNLWLFKDCVHDLHYKFNVSFTLIQFWTPSKWVVLKYFKSEMLFVKNVCRPAPRLRASHPPLHDSALEACPAKMPQVQYALDRATRHRHWLWTVPSLHSALFIALAGGAVHVLISQLSRVHSACTEHGTAWYPHCPNLTPGRLPGLLRAAKTEPEAVSMCRWQMCQPYNWHLAFAVPLISLLMF